MSFDPTTYGTVELWLSALAGVNGGAPSDGTPVTVWHDQSGNGYDATPPEGNALWQAAGLNGLPTLRFDGTTYYTAGTNGLVLNQPDTIIIVGEMTTFDNGYFFDAVDGGNRQLLLNDNGSGQNFLAIYAGAQEVGSSAAAWPYVFTCVFDDADGFSRLFFDDVAVNEGTIGGGPLGSAEMPGMVIGARTSNNYLLSGAISEIIAFSGVPSDLPGLISALLARWSIQPPPVPMFWLCGDPCDSGVCG